ncbi:MAG: hypothetical protein JSS07_12315 [Proteobacteria bacterium]|nr:hypothetical protein [Pseudomonadota bacterium]
MASALTPAARQMVERRLLGWGVAVAPLASGDCTRVDLAFERGALVAVESRAALLQDLALVFCTGLGTDPLNMGTGFDGPRLVAEEDDPAMLSERLRAAAALVPHGDPRVARVVDVQLAAAVAEDERPGRARPTRLVITTVFDLVTGERVDVSLGGVAIDG